MSKIVKPVLSKARYIVTFFSLTGAQERGIRKVQQLMIPVERAAICQNGRLFVFWRSGRVSAFDSLMQGKRVKPSLQFASGDKHSSAKLDKSNRALLMLQPVADCT